MAQNMTAEQEARLDLATGLSPKVAQVAAEVASRNIGREAIVHCTMLSLVAGHPAFFLGPPGINKTGTVQSLSRAIAGASFYDALIPTVVSPEQLLVEETTIEEAVSAGGVKSIRTRDRLGRAAAAHIVFADEIWKGEPRVLQTLLDLSKGDGVRHEGQMVATPLLSFVAASNELPDPEGNLGAMWSRMTIRAVVNPLDRAGKKSLFGARLARDRGTAPATPVSLALAEIELLREARAFVEVGSKIQDTILDLAEGLFQDSAEEWSWLWNDDRRMGRVIDVLQASALLDGRAQVNTQDLRVLEYLFWDTVEQIPHIRGKLAPLVRTPLSDAREQFEALQAPGGAFHAVMQDGNRLKLAQGLTQIEGLECLLEQLEAEAGAVEKPQIAVLCKRLGVMKKQFVAKATNTPLVLSEEECKYADGNP